MKTISLVAAFLVTLILISCSSNFQLVDKQKAGSNSADSNGFFIAGSTTNPEAIIYATGQYHVNKAQAESTILNAQGRLLIETAVANAIDSVAKTFRENPENVQALPEIIMALAIKDLTSQGLNTSYYGNQLLFETRRQLARQKFSYFHNNPAYNPWLR